MEEKYVKSMNRNIKAFPTYMTLTWDVFFVWTISIMFFTNQKGLSYSEAIMLDSILMLFGSILCLIVPKIFSKISPLVSSRIAHIGYAGYLLLCIFGKSYFMFVLAQLFLAVGYSVFALKTNTILTDSLSAVKRDKEYEKVYGKGLSNYYIVDAVGAILITYVYNWNPYMAYWISVAVVAISFAFSFIFTEPNKYQATNITDENVKQKKSAKSSSYFKILSSAFILSMMIYMFFFRGILSITSSAFKMYLQLLTESNVLPIWLFGYIYGALKICTAISTKYQFKYNLKFGVKSLIIFNVLCVSTFVLNGILFIINPTSWVNIVLIILSSFIQGSLRTPNQIFINSYIQVCVQPKDVEKVYALRISIEYMGYALISFIYTLLLDKFNYGLTNLIYICIFALPLLTSMIVFIRLLCKKYAQKYTIIKSEYVED